MQLLHTCDVESVSPMICSDSMHLLWHCTISQLILTYSCIYHMDITWMHVSYLWKILLHLFSELGSIVALPHIVQLLKEAGRPLIQQTHHVCLDVWEPPQKHGKFPAPCISVSLLEPQSKQINDGRNANGNSSLRCHAHKCCNSFVALLTTHVGTLSKHRHQPQL